jgi:regulator of sirC expression with transglutaminase-like and TPR domain
MPTASELRALVSLLSDDDPKILAMVWDHLGRLGFEAIPALQEAGECPDPRLRARARHALNLISLDDIEQSLHAIAAGDEEVFDLEGAFHALARIEYPDLAREEISWGLDDLAARVRPHLESSFTLHEEVRALQKVFDGELRFRGPHRNLRDADGACLQRVLATRRGSPISLGVIILLVGERLRIPLAGVGLPNHFLVEYADEAEEIFIDPSHGARILNRREVVESFLRDYYPKDSYIHRVSGREITIRALRSLILLYSKHQDKARVRRLGRFLEILQIRERAR